MVERKATTLQPLKALEGPVLKVLGKRRQRAVIGAARQIRDDLYWFQDLLADSLETPNDGGINWSPVRSETFKMFATDDDYRLLSEVMPGRPADEAAASWARLSRARRLLLDGAHIYNSRIHPGREWAVELFSVLEQGRMTLSLYLDEWEAQSHERASDVLQ